MTTPTQQPSFPVDIWRNQIESHGSEKQRAGSDIDASQGREATLVEAKILEVINKKNEGRFWIPPIFFKNHDTSTNIVILSSHPNAEGYNSKQAYTLASHIVISNTSLGNDSFLAQIVAGSISEPNLKDALNDLGKARNEAREEGFPRPSDMAMKNADWLLREMYRISPRRFEVYPTPDGEIAIDAPDGQGRSVILLCNAEGGALCLVNMSGKHRCARYDTTETLPDGFVREALAELKQQGKQSP